MKKTIHGLSVILLASLLFCLFVSCADTSGKQKQNDSEGGSAQTEEVSADSENQAMLTEDILVGTWKTVGVEFCWLDICTEEQKNEIISTLAALFGEGLSDDEYLEKFGETMAEDLEDSELIFNADHTGSNAGSNISWTLGNNSVTVTDEEDGISTDITYKGENLCVSEDGIGISILITYSKI